MFKAPTERQRLAAWVEANMPLLDAYLSTKSTSTAVRLELNRITGLDIKGDDGLQDTCLMFREALMAMSEDQLAAVGALYKPE